SIALTSMWEASVGAVETRGPVSRLTTPPGTSEAASTSAKVIAGRGGWGEAATTVVLPVTTTGATTLTRPSRLEPAGASTATTPVGSGVERLKNAPATGFAFPTTWVTWSAQPAYQPSRSIAASTALPAAA